jgi:hypothetical protein
VGGGIHPDSWEETTMSDEGYLRWKGGRSPEAGACWQAVADRVRGEMTRGNWTIYFSRSRGLALGPGKDRGRVLTVGAPNTSAAEGLEEQFARLIRRALDADGHRDLAVHVVLLPTTIDARGDEVVDVDGLDVPRDAALAHYERAESGRAT